MLVSPLLAVNRFSTTLKSLWNPGTAELHMLIEPFTELGVYRILFFIMFPVGLGWPASEGGMLMHQRPLAAMMIVLLKTLLRLEPSVPSLAYREMPLA